LNPYTFRYRILSPARLPIPPLLRRIIPITRNIVYVVNLKGFGEVFTAEARRGYWLFVVGTVAQGLANGEDTLKLIQDVDSRPAIRAIRMYRPSVK
jgi:hypothetical protein